MREATWTIALAALCLALAGPAGAGVSYELVFRSTDALGNPIAGGTAGGGSFSFSSVAAARACDPVSRAGCAVMDLLLLTTDPLIANAITVGFDDSASLAAARARNWAGVGILFHAGTPIDFYAPLSGVDCEADFCGSFNSVVVPPNGPPSLPTGTYNIGTIIWDTSVSKAGLSDIATVIRPGWDATGAVIDGEIVNITGSEVMGSGSILVTPEPSTGALLALGLAGACLAVRRGRS
jgi:hypothetical protein